MLRTRRAAAAEPASDLAQIFLDGRVRRPTSRNYEANTVATMRLAIAARERLFAIAERENIDFDSRSAASCTSTATKASFEQPPASTRCCGRAGSTAQRDARRDDGASSRRCTATITAASSRRRIRPATSTNSPAAWPRPACGAASSFVYDADDDGGRAGQRVDYAVRWSPAHSRGEMPSAPDPCRSTAS